MLGSCQLHQSYHQADVIDNLKWEPQMKIAKDYILPIWGVRLGSEASWSRVC